MPKRAVFAINVLLVMLLLTAAQGSQAAEDIKAVPKKGNTFAPPLSENLPDAYATLPGFGAITWETTKLPWVGEGPYEGISGMGMVVSDGIIYLCGGFIPGGDGSGDSASHRTSRWTWQYDPATDTWTQLPDAPIRREYNRAIAAQNQVVLVGGGCQYKGSDPPYQVHGDCAALYLGGKKPAWRKFPALNVPRTHTAVGSAGKYLMVIGGNEYAFEENGYSNATIRATTEVFDLKQPNKGWQRKTSIPGAGRGWVASFCLDEKLYLFGGVTWDEDNNTVGIRESLVYDPQRDAWTERAPSPIAMSGWEGDCYGKRYALLVGGVARPKPETKQPMVWSDLVWAYDLQDDQWLRVEGTLPPGAVFNDPGVVVIGDTIYVIGAEGPDGSHYNYFLKGRIRPQSP